MKVTIAIQDANITKSVTLGMLPRESELIDIFALLNTKERAEIKEKYGTFTFRIAAVAHQVSEMHHIASLWLEKTD